MWQPLGRARRRAGTGRDGVRCGGAGRWGEGKGGGGDEEVGEGEGGVGSGY